MPPGDPASSASSGDLPPSTVPVTRITLAARAPVDASRDWVLYWQVAARRTRWNFALDRAVEHARTLGRPLLVLEPLRAGYRWASDRLHRFCIDGMAENARRYTASGIAYHPYVEPADGDGRGLLEALAARACVVVTDEYPEFFLPRMIAAAGARLLAIGTRLEVVDSNGLLPLRSTDKAFGQAVHFRWHLQRALPEQLGAFPAEDPLRAARALPAIDDDALRALDVVRARWPAASPALLAGEAGTLDAIAIDHAVPPVALAGGSAAGRRVVQSFVRDRLARYATERNQPIDGASSGLSPYLHWGFVSAHEVFAAVAEHEGWNPGRLAPKPNGRRAGWWGMSADAESFLDELVTWRELSFNTSFRLPHHRRWESLPPWAIETLEAHADDPREHLYDRATLEAGGTGDVLWNATQGQLLADGRIHNALRIHWGKRFLEWTRHPREALALMAELNNRWALDGRDPNSWSGIMWTLGRYDHGWQERPILGKVRASSEGGIRKKMEVDAYVRRYSPTA